MTDKRTSRMNPLRPIAMVVALIGAIGSLYFMSGASHNQKSILLITLFTGWVLSPFALFLVADKISARWAARARSSLYCLMITVAVISLVIYSGALMPPKAKLTFLFLIVPLISLLFAIVSIWIGRRSAAK